MLSLQPIQFGHTQTVIEPSKKGNRARRIHRPDAAKQAQLQKQKRMQHATAQISSKISTKPVSSPDIDMALDMPYHTALIPEGKRLIEFLKNQYRQMFLTHKAGQKSFLLGLNSFQSNHPQLRSKVLTRALKINRHLWSLKQEPTNKATQELWFELNS